MSLFVSLDNYTNHGIKDMQRFQVSYNLKAIPEIQEYLNVCFENARKHGDLKDLYRRRSVVLLSCLSLMLMTLD